MRPALFNSGRVARRSSPWRLRRRLLLGLMAFVLLGYASSPIGATADSDPPPQLPEKWNTGVSRQALGQPHEGSRWAASQVVAHATSDAPLDAPLPLGLDPAVQDPAGAVAFGQSTVATPHFYPSDAAPLGDLWLLPKSFRPSRYGPHQGEGEPLLGASWLNRPYYAGFFLGALHGDTLIPGEINQSIGFFGGFRLGWDYDTYWGLETRVGFSELGLDFIDEPSVDGLATDIVVWDASLVYYPWGESRWRPYLSLGLGLVDYDFLDEFGLRHSDAVVGLPWGVGLKYRQSDWVTLRFDLLDNVAFGGKAGFETMNNLSLTGGLEFRFGGTRKSYFPWNPSRTIR